MPVIAIPLAAVAVGVAAATADTFAIVAAVGAVVSAVGAVTGVKELTYAGAALGAVGAIGGLASAAGIFSAADLAPAAGLTSTGASAGSEVATGAQNVADSSIAATQAPSAAAVGQTPGLVTSDVSASDLGTGFVGTGGQAPPATNVIDTISGTAAPTTTPTAPITDPNAGTLPAAAVDQNTTPGVTGESAIIPQGGGEGGTLGTTGNPANPAEAVAPNAPTTPAVKGAPATTTPTDATPATPGQSIQDNLSNFPLGGGPKGPSGGSVAPGSTSVGTSAWGKIFDFIKDNNKLVLGGLQAAGSFMSGALSPLTPAQVAAYQAQAAANNAAAGLYGQQQSLLSWQMQNIQSPLPRATGGRAVVNPAGPPSGTTVTGNPQPTGTDFTSAAIRGGIVPRGV